MKLVESLINPLSFVKLDSIQKEPEPAFLAKFRLFDTNPELHSGF